MNFGRLRNKVEEVVEPESVPNGIVGDHTTDSTAIITLSGKIDATNFQSVQDKALAILNSTTITELIFDADQVSYVSSAGLRMFNAINQQAQHLQKAYKVINMRSDIAKMFHMMGYGSAFDIQVKE